MPEIIEAKINGEFKIKLPKHRADIPDWYTDHGWEKERLKSMHEHLKKGDKMCYVGAEEGDMPALCEIWGVDTYMIEPSPSFWPNIKAIWDANELKKPLGCFAGFAGNETVMNPEMLNFDNRTGEDDWPNCSVGEVKKGSGFRHLHEQADSTPQIKIDDIGIDFTAFSIDVEGSEMRVLEGAEKTIEKNKPKIWLSGHPEFMQHMYGEYLGDVRNWIKDRGYSEELLAYDHEVHFYYEAR